MTGQKTWAVGEEVLATDFNNYVQTQVVAQFATVAARDAWGSPPNGALCITLDTGTLWERYGVGWRRPYDLPWGRLGHATKSADQAGIGNSMTDIAGLSVGPVSVGGNRLIRVTAYLYFQPSAATFCQFRIMADAAQNQITAASPGAGTSAGSTMIGLYGVATPSTPTFKVQGLCGTGTMTVQGATAPCHIIVEDIGPFGTPV